jgi:type II secretory pathway predicted ATPase ExeA
MLAQLIKQKGITQRALVRGTGSSCASISRLVLRGEWPARDGGLKQRVQAFLQAQGCTRNEVTRALAKQAGAMEQATLTEQAKDETMYIPYEAITAETLEYFKLTHSPFRRLRHIDDVFVSRHMRAVILAMADVAKSHGFGAVVGDSGAGKTTLTDALEHKLAEQKANVLLIRPSVVGMSASEKSGQTLKVGQITEAIIRALAPSRAMPNSSEARSHLAQVLLRESVAAGTRHLMLLEEAHDTPTQTLKHLKRLNEIKVGMQPLLGVLLVSQPELLDKLNGNNAQLREVYQRCEVIELHPLEADLEGYLAHLIKRAGATYDKVLAPNAAAAIAARLRALGAEQARHGAVVVTGRSGQARGGMSYPLAVNNLVARGLNAVAAASYERLDADVIKTL